MLHNRRRPKWTLSVYIIEEDSSGHCSVYIIEEDFLRDPVNYSLFFHISWTTFNFNRSHLGLVA